MAGGGNSTRDPQTLKLLNKTDMNRGIEVMRKPFSEKIAHGKEFVTGIMRNRRLLRAVKGVAAIVCTALILSFSAIRTVDEVIAAPTVGNFGMTIKLLEWKRVYEMGTNDFRGALVWGNGNPYYFTSGRSIGLRKNSDKRWDYWDGQPNTIDPYLDFGKDKFINRNYHDIPWFVNAKSLNKDDAARSGDYLGNSARFSIKLCPDLGHTQWVHTPKNNIVGSNDRTVFNILDYNHDNKGDRTKNMNKAATKTSKGYVRLFAYHAESECQDFYHSDNYISVHWNDNWPTNDFMLYQVDEKSYAAMSDYTVTDGQIFVNKDSSFLLDEKKLTVEKDGVLSVQGTFYYNGEIECSGTIILQEGATMVPFHANGKAGGIKLKDGGTIIIMPNARLFAGYPGSTLGSTKKALFDVENGTIINYGLFVYGYGDLSSETTIEMHNNSEMYIGYRPSAKNPNGMFTSLEKKPDQTALGLETLINDNYINHPNIYLYENCKVHIYPSHTNKNYLSVTTYKFAPESGEFVTNTIVPKKTTLQETLISN